MINAGIIGSTGYAGEQLVWFLYNHPEVQINFLCSRSFVETSFDSIYVNYRDIIQQACISIQQVPDKLKSLDVLFIALPHGKSFDIVEKALSEGVKVIDLGADYRLNSEECYKEWYGIEHKCAHLLKDAAYGLPELYREKIRKSSLIANPGCYPTASILALAPLLKNNMVDVSSIIIDAKSGVTGAGRNASINNLYCECNESIKAYGVATHRHTPEIEQELSHCSGKDVVITFTPHLIPMNRGILSVCYSKLTKEIDEEGLYKLYEDFYKGENFIKIIDSLPETRWVKGSNFCHIGLRLDKRTGRVIVISAIDNLIKGAAGQAVQNMNIMFGIDEALGLKLPAMFP